MSLIESYRDSLGKPRMRTLANLGKVEDFHPETLRRVGQRLYELGGGDVRDLLDGTLAEVGRYNFGYTQLVSHLLSYYGLDTVCRRIKNKHRLSYDLSSVLRLMLIERLHEPCSKRANYYHQGDYYAQEEIPLHHIYRSLDKLAQYSNTIQDHIFAKSRHLFNQKLDLVFYDVTTLYFDSEIVIEGELRQKGFSKDGKIGKTQVVLAMMIDRYKQPVAYHIFEGNTFEGHTLKTALEDISKRYQLDKIIVVADRGMLSKENIELISEQLGLNYILGERLKNRDKKTQQLFLDLSKYDQQWVYDKNGKQIKIKYYAQVIGQKRIISTYSEKRAKKDRHKREERIAKAEKLLKTPTKLDSKARIHYLKRSGKNTLVLNQKKIKADQQFDGILAIATNEMELPEAEILDQYRHLFQIEQGFRTMKSLLEIRPIFHWTDQRIKGHICMCFIALAMIRNVELRLEKGGHKWSESKIIKTLDMMQVSQIEQHGNTFFLRSKATTEQDLLTQVFRLKKIKPISPKSLKIK